MLDVLHKICGVSEFNTPYCIIYYIHWASPAVKKSTTPSTQNKDKAVGRYRDHHLCWQISKQLVQTKCWFLCTIDRNTDKETSLVFIVCTALAHFLAICLYSTPVLGCFLPVLATGLSVAAQKTSPSLW